MHQAVAGLQNSSLMTGGLEPRFWVMNDDPVNAAWAQAEVNQARIDLANDPVLWPFATGPSPATDTSPDPDVASDPAPQAPPLHLDGLPSGREAEIDGRVYEQIYFANNTCRRCAFNSVTLCPPKPDFEVLCTPDENADGMARQWRLKVQEEIGDD
jgi:hypothetical protein